MKIFARVKIPCPFPAFSLVDEHGEADAVLLGARRGRLYSWRWIELPRGSVVDRHRASCEPVGAYLHQAEEEDSRCHRSRDNDDEFVRLTELRDFGFKFPCNIIVALILAVDMVALADYKTYSTKRVYEPLAERRVGRRRHHERRARTRLLCSCHKDHRCMLWVAMFSVDNYDFRHGPILLDP